MLDGNGAVLWLVTDTDLMGLEQKTPLWLKVDIERAPTADDVVVAGRRLPEAVRILVDANVDPLDVAHMVAVTVGCPHAEVSRPRHGTTVRGAGREAAARGVVRGDSAPASRAHLRSDRPPLDGGMTRRGCRACLTVEPHPSRGRPPRAFASQPTPSRRSPTAVSHGAC
jgi:hypothetical protein